MATTIINKNNFQKELTIDEHKIIITSNRSVISIVQNCMSNYVKANKTTKGITVETQTDYMFYGLLKTEQPLITLKEARDLRQKGLLEANYGTRFDDVIKYAYNKCEVKGKRDNELNFLDEDKEEDKDENILDY